MSYDDIWVGDLSGTVLAALAAACCAQHGLKTMCFICYDALKLATYKGFGKGPQPAFRCPIFLKLQAVALRQRLCSLRFVGHGVIAMNLESTKT